MLYKKNTLIKSKKLALLLFSLALAQITHSKNHAYFPPPGEWERKTPESLGLSTQKLLKAIDLAKKNTVVEPHDMSKFIENSFGKEPLFSIMGPVKSRENGSGIVIYRGYIVAEWGDIEREDMTFSVTKSYLSTIAGLAYDEGLISDTKEKVKISFPHKSFSDAHNESITWENFLHQNSDWSGTLWGKPDWADRPANYDPKIAINRVMHQPGSFYKYNDTRVNMLAFSLLNLWRRPLDDILKEQIMDPIGASNEWQWHGYRNSWVEIDGKRMQSPSGGGHWGGGFFISTLDHARYGYLFMNNGKWNDQQLISKDWIKMATTPSSTNSRYGYLWWLNTNHAVSNAPTSAFYASGAGGNYIWIDQENQLLIVMRWVRNMREVLAAFTESVEK
ncbi:MAG: serine hydrolase [Pseudomonadota bacterium]|nr:serine hydrolase [Pseudomonadota bacterium]